MALLQIPTVRFRTMFPIALLLLMVFCLAHGNVAIAATPDLLFLKNKKQKKEAIEAIPLKKLTEDYQAKLQRVTDNPSIFRSMPKKEIECDPEMYLFLIRHPEVIVNMWDIMGITKVKIQRTGKFTFSAADGAGTESNIELLYGTPTLHLFYAEGAYEGPLLKQKVDGRCLLVLRSDYQQRDDRDYITSRLDVFVQLDHVGVAVLLKTLHPLIGKTADYNFAESAGFLGRVSEAAELNAPGVQRLADKLTKVDPEIRKKFTELTHSVNQKAALKVDENETGKQPPAKTLSSADLKKARSQSSQSLDFSEYTKNARLSTSVK